jgi:hypothetical protein
LKDVFSGRADWDAALQHYEMARNAAVKEIYELNAAYASLQPPAPEVQMVLQALPGNAEQTTRLFGTMTGAVAPSDFYAPENVTRLLDCAHKQTRVATRVA